MFGWLGKMFSGTGSRVVQEVWQLGRAQAEHGLYDYMKHRLDILQKVEKHRAKILHLIETLKDPNATKVLMRRYNKVNAASKLGTSGFNEDRFATVLVEIMDPEAGLDEEQQRELLVILAHAKDDEFNAMLDFMENNPLWHKFQHLKTKFRELKQFLAVYQERVVEELRKLAAELDKKAAKKHKLKYSPFRGFYYKEV